MTKMASILADSSYGQGQLRQIEAHLVFETLDEPSVAGQGYSFVCKVFGPESELTRRFSLVMDSFF